MYRQTQVSRKYSTAQHSVNMRLPERGDRKALEGRAHVLGLDWSEEFEAVAARCDERGEEARCPTKYIQVGLWYCAVGWVHAM